MSLYVIFFQCYIDKIWAQVEKLITSLDEKIFHKNLLFILFSADLKGSLMILYKS